MGNECKISLKKIKKGQTKKKLFAKTRDWSRAILRAKPRGVLRKSRAKEERTGRVS